MKTLVAHITEKLRTSFWFVPGIILAGFALAGFACLEIDRRWGEVLVSTLPGLSDVSAAGVRTLLSTSATAVLTLAGVTFSATLVALTLASGQFGSRLLRNFIRALPNQIAMGVLLGNFVLCLIVLRSVRDFEDGHFIPHVATFLAFIGTLTSLVTFIYFVHHLAKSLQAERIVANVHDELDAAIERQFPRSPEDEVDERESKELRDRWKDQMGEAILESDRSGYVQAINVAALVELIHQLGADACGSVLAHPGQFIVEGNSLIALDGGEFGDCEPWKQCFLIGKERTPEQDFEHCIRQLVEVGLRALSPGINDPFTAMHCIDYLGAAMAKAVGRHLPAYQFSDADGKVRLVTRPVTYHCVLATAFHQLRQAAAGKPDIAMRMLEAFSNIARNCRSAEARAAIGMHADALEAALETEHLAEPERTSVQDRIQRVKNELRADQGTP